MANDRHQYIRRNCHLIRRAFRAPFVKPPRHFGTCTFCDGTKDTISTYPEAMTVECDTMGKKKESMVIIDAEVQAVL